MRGKKRLFVILWVAGLAGVVSLLLVDFAALAASLRVLEGTEVPPLTPLLKVLTLLQPAVLVGVAVLIGVAFASKVGLSAPVAEAVAGGGRLGAALKPQIVPGLCGGVAGGIAIVLAALVERPYLPAEVIARISKLGNLLPVPTRLLYGGITEEVLLRWGFMTLLVWAWWRVFQKGQGSAKGGTFVGAIVISSVVFGIGHLPLAFALVGKVSIGFGTYVIVANSLFGLIAGYLYWKKGLEAAMIAHLVTHVVLLGASYLGAYF